ncbi:DUF2931 family protein [Pedobacter duraquae]|uniref:DUF2931 family protein n=1 Tax=Pedobacter duraquae TaxID=425511 RepID=A0A4R6IQJ9_9SPHI|nr:DUF2931 family protein [Pedobacter duraquae]TDO24306.1 Protein of unknown function (DUF2931) [Pedobacter duraquae]
MRSFKKAILPIFLIVLCFATALYFYLKRGDPAWNKMTWGTAVSDRYLWPMMVSTARFITPDGLSIEVSEFGHEQYYPLSGKWGVGNGENHGNNEPLPLKLSIDWLSLREKTWYKGAFELPEARLDSLFKAVKGDQLVLGLDTGGVIVLWVKGAGGKREAATFTARAYQPDWKNSDLSPKETESAYMDRVYQLVTPEERDAIALAQPLKEQKAKDGVYTGIYEFIAEMRMEGDNLLLVHKQHDSMALINLGGVPKALNQGDLIRLDWKIRQHSANRDSVAPAQRQVVLNASLFEKGKLSKLIDRHIPDLEGAYLTTHISEPGKELMQRTISYYLANSKDKDIRKAVDLDKADIKFTVDDYGFKTERGYKIAITPNVANPSFAHWVYYSPRHLFYIMEWEEARKLKAQTE